MWSKLARLASMAPMARLGSASPMGIQAGVATPKLNVFHRPPPECAMITCAGSAGLTRMPLTRPASMAEYGTALNSKAAVLGPTLTQDGAVTSASGPAPGAAGGPGISGAQPTDSW